MFRQLSRRLKSDFVLAQRAADGSLQMADINVMNKDLTWSTSIFAQGFFTFSYMSLKRL